MGPSGSPQRRSKGRQNRASLPTVLTLEPRLSSDLVPRDDPSQIKPWWSTQAHGPNKTEVNRAIQGAIYIGYAIRQFFNVSSSFLRSKTGDEHCFNCDLSRQISTASQNSSQIDCSVSLC